MTPSQLSALKTAILADTDPAVIAARNVRNDTELARLYNLAASPAVPAWLAHASNRQIFDAMNINIYDAVAAGKRAGWELMIQIADIDFGRQNYRKAVSDIWSAQTQNQRDAILSSLTESATKAEVACGGSNETEGGVTALDRNFSGQISVTDVSTALGA